MKLQKYVFFVVFLNILTVNCTDNRSAYEVSKDKSIPLLALDWYQKKVSKVTRTATDNMDGMVTITDVDYYGKSTLVGYVKKCLQGQVYRQSANDCKGTGSASDVYGATKLQYCDKEDNSCNGGTDEGVLDGGGNSEVFKSCDSETLQGKKWYAGFILSGLDSSYRYTVLSNIYEIGDDLDLWGRKSYSSGRSYLYQFVTGSFSISEVVKTNQNYVLCISDN